MFRYHFGGNSIPHLYEFSYKERLNANQPNAGQIIYCSTNLINV